MIYTFNMKKWQKPIQGLCRFCITGQDGYTVSAKDAYLSVSDLSSEAGMVWGGRVVGSW